MTDRSFLDTAITVGKTVGMKISGYKLYHPFIYSLWNNKSSTYLSPGPQSNFVITLLQMQQSGIPHKMLKCQCQTENKT